MECTSTCIAAPETVYTLLSNPALLFDWLIILTLTIFDNITLDKVPGVKVECTSTFMEPETVYTSLSYPALLFDWLITLTLTTHRLVCVGGGLAFESVPLAAQPGG